jgi:hypothetical protein
MVVFKNPAKQMGVNVRVGKAKIVEQTKQGLLMTSAGQSGSLRLCRLKVCMTTRRNSPLMKLGQASGIVLCDPQNI